MIKLTIPGVPVSWKSHAGYGKKSFNPLFKERDYVQHYIKQQYHDEILKIPVSITYHFYLPIPKSFSKKKRESAIKRELLPTTRKDITNLQKFLEDCIKTVVIEDDCLVVESIGRKYYSVTPHTEVEIFPYTSHTAEVH